MGDGKFTISFLFVLIILSTAASAGFIEDVKYQAECLAGSVRNFTIGTETIIVMGTYASKSEKLAFKAASEQFPDIMQCTTLKDTDSENIDLSGKTVFLVGGPNQNLLTKKVLETPGCTTETEETPLGVLEFITTPDGQRYVIISDKAGYDNLARTSAQKSPLAKIIPVEYVPAAATAIGLTLIWLWSFIINFLKRVLRLIVSAKIMKRIRKKEWNPNFKGFRIFGIRIKYREWVSIVLAAATFAFAISYTYLQEGMAILSFIAVNIVVNAIIYAIRNLTRLYMDKKHDIHTEYVFWYWGAFVVLMSGWLGNSFSLAGYTINDKDKKTDKEAKISYTIDLFSIIAALGFFIWNLISPSVLLQMATTLAVSISIVQMLPIEPFGGKNIYRWSKKRWWLLFIPILILFIWTQLIM